DGRSVAHDERATGAGTRRTPPADRAVARAGQPAGTDARWHYRARFGGAYPLLESGRRRDVRLCGHGGPWPDDSHPPSHGISRRAGHGQRWASAYRTVGRRTPPYVPGWQPPDRAEPPDP